MPHVAHLYRYPIKGFTAQPVDAVALRAGGGFPGDRMFALARPDGPYSEMDFVPLPKRDYFMLMKDERMAGLTTHLDVDTLALTISVRGHVVLRADLSTAEGITELRRFYARILDLPTGSLPTFAVQDGYNFTDSARSSRMLMNSLSIINLASVRDLERRIGTPVDPLRFRANVYLDGLEPWEERSWLGREFTIGGVSLRGVEETTRCAATEVDPETARRDIPLPRLLVENYGDDVLGIFGEMISDGRIAVGDSVAVGDLVAAGDTPSERHVSSAGGMTSVGDIVSAGDTVAAGGAGAAGAAGGAGAGGGEVPA